MRRMIEDLRDTAGPSAGQVLGAGIAAAGVVVGFLTFGVGAGLVISGLTVLSVTTDAKLTQIRKATRALERAVEDLNACLG